MVPIQLWLPFIQGGVPDEARERDRQRAFEARDRDDVIWLMPGWDGPETWTEPGVRIRCLRSEEMECIRILNIGENLQVVGPDAGDFPEHTARGLLECWVEDRELPLAPVADGQSAEREIAVSVPFPVKGGVTYRLEKLLMKPSGRIPATHYDDEKQVVFFSWPGREDAPRPVSPAQESRRSDIKDSKGALWSRIVWPAPFDKLMPMSDSFDDLFARDQMRTIAEDSQQDRMVPGKRVAEQSRVWISDGHSDVNETWLKPIISKEGEEGALFALESQFGISASSLDEVYQDQDARSRLQEPVKVRRAWGVPGLMWAFLMDRFEAGGGLRFCERCGRLLPQRSRASFCSARHNPACRRGYERERKQRRRAR